MEGVKNNAPHSVPFTLPASAPSLLGQWLRGKWMESHEGFACRLAGCECSAKHWGAPWDCNGLSPADLENPVGDYAKQKTEAAQ